MNLFVDFKLTIMFLNSILLFSDVFCCCCFEYTIGLSGWGEVVLR